MDNSNKDNPTSSLVCRTKQSGVQLASQPILLASPAELTARYRGTTALDAFKSDEQSLLSMTKSAGEEMVQDMLYLHLDAFNRFLNLKNGMTEEQITYVVDTLMHDPIYKHWSMGDIYIIIDRIKSGKCGKLYESMSATKFLEACLEYDAERTAAIEQYQAESNNKHIFDRPDAGSSKLPYYIVKDADGRTHIEFTAKHKAKMAEEEAKAKAVEAENQRKQTLVADIRKQAERLQQEEGISLADAYMRVINAKK